MFFRSGRLRSVWSLALLCVLCLSPGAGWAEAVRSQNSSTELLAEQAAVKPGDAVRLALVMRPDKNWHTYWSNPGEVGQPTTVKWSNSVGGVRFGRLQFPRPTIIKAAGFSSYGYEGDSTLLVRASIPRSAQIGSILTFTGRVNWLACDPETCVPEMATVTLSIPVAAATRNDPDQRTIFLAAQQALPRTAPWQAIWQSRGGTVLLGIKTRTALQGKLAFYPAENGILDSNAPQKASAINGYTVISMRAAPGKTSVSPTSGLLIVDQTAYQLHPTAGIISDLVPMTKDEPGRTTGDASAQRGGTSIAAPDPQPRTESEISRPPSPANDTVSVEAGPSDDRGIIHILVLALLGGLILNVMPCVFPILSLKALAIAKSHEPTSKDAVAEALHYTAGVIVSFGLLGMGIFVLNSSGHSAGWGMQMQSPLFVGLLIVVTAVISLNLLGTFEVGARMMGMGQGLTRAGGRRGSFFTGVLAVVMATPCSAPFMASAVGIALIRPPIESIAIFVVMGLGLSLPFLMLAAFPSLGRRLPKPGRWMDTLRKTLAFPMLLTTIWLVWNLGRLTDVDVMTVALIAALAAALACWCFGQQQATGSGFRWRIASVLSLSASVACLFAVATMPTAARGIPAVASGPQPFSEAATREAIAHRQPVFLYFTADWCITCKINERAALDTEQTRKIWAQNKVKVMVGDWTRQDEAITRYLKLYGRAGVPLYVYYPAGSTYERGQVLPQILTPGTIASYVTPS